MKKTVITCFLLASMAAFGQKNVVKLTLAPTKLILANNVALSYERKLTDRFSAGLRFNFSSKNAAPLSGELSRLAEESLNNAEVNADIFNNKFTSTGFALEFKYYPGAKALKGFYLAPYLSLQSGSFEDFDFNFQDKTNPLVTNAGNVAMDFNFFGGGIGIGNQWLIADRIAIDILWVGLGVGANTFNVEGTDPSKEVDFDEIKKDVDQFIQDNKDEAINYFTKDIESSNTDESITISSSSLVPLVKILNFSIGFAF